MGDKDTAARLRQIIIDQTGIEAEQVTDHALLIDDLGLDTLDIVELAMEIEQQFEGVEIDESSDFETVRDLAVLIDRQLVSA